MADAATDREALRAEFKRLVQKEGLAPDQAMARIRGGASAMAPPAPAAEAQSEPGVSQAESAGRGVLQGATFKLADEWTGAAEALGRKIGDVVYGNEGQKGYTERYREIRDESRASNDAAQEANPKTYLAGEIAGGIATAPALPGGAVASLGKAVTAGAAYGAAAGLGGSKADLTKGEGKQALVDTAVGAGFGAVGGAAGQGIGKAFKAAGEKLQSLGQARLFKGAVGQNKKAFSQINGKGLFEKSGQYLDSMGIGVGDSTESIGAKLSQKSESLYGELDSLVSSLDEAAAPKITPAEVAARIEKEVAEPLKKLVANKQEYAEVLDAIKGIREIGENLPFKEAAAQRRAFQQQVNYDRHNKRDISAEAKQKIAQIWNDVIDDAAEPVLQKLGKAGDAYRELRHEAGLVTELLGHVNNRISGNQANRMMSPSDYGMGAIGGIMTGNPFVGLAAAGANHLGRVYGNTAAGRAAINVAKFAAGSSGAMNALAPSLSRAAEKPTIKVPAYATEEEPRYIEEEIVSATPRAIGRGST